MPSVCGVVAMVLLLSACPEGQRKAAEPSRGPAACSKAYEKCDLGQGRLGVCDVVECAPDAQEPCLACRSQH